MADHEGRLFGILWVEAVESRDGEVGFDNLVLQLAKMHLQFALFLQEVVVLNDQFLELIDFDPHQLVVQRAEIENSLSGIYFQASYSSIVEIVF